jgi:hypothetical protein
LGLNPAGYGNSAEEAMKYAAEDFVFRIRDFYAQAPNAQWLMNDDGFQKRDASFRAYFKDWDVLLGHSPE